MTSYEYDILGWNGINSENQIILASLYIKPDLKLLDLFNRAPMHNLLVKIKESNSVYDNKDIFATIDKSADVPNCRQNFFNCTGLYVITLDHTWMGYPIQNGKIVFSDDAVVAKLVDKLLPDNSTPKSLGVQSTPAPNSIDPFHLERMFSSSPPSTSPSKNGSGFSKTFLIVLGIILFIILLVVLVNRNTGNGISVYI